MLTIGVIAAQSVASDTPGLSVLSDSSPVDSSGYLRAVGEVQDFPKEGRPVALTVGAVYAQHAVW